MIRTKTIASLVVLSFALAGAACKKEQKQDKPEPTGQQKPDDTKKPDEAKMPDAGAAGAETVTLVDPGAEDRKPVTRAVAVIHPTKGNKVKGTIWFEAADKGLTVKTEITGLPAGKHAYHVHLYGDCTGPDAKTAGTHFHFTGPSENPPADIKIITGDLGELEGKGGKATAEATIDDASLQGEFSILGRAVVIHEKGNDPTKPPMGDAGGRLGCGVIGIAAGM